VEFIDASQSDVEELLSCRWDGSKKVAVLIDNADALLTEPGEAVLNARYLKASSLVLLAIGFPLPLQVGTELREVRLGPFYRPQVRQLVDLLGLKGTLSRGITDAIYRWTSGHPYLVQKVCLFLAEGRFALSEEGVEEAARWLARYDDLLLPRLLGVLDSAPEARSLVKSILLGEKIRYRKALSYVKRHPDVWGLLGCDEDGFCVFSAPIVEEAVKSRLL